MNSKTVNHKQSSRKQGWPAGAVRLATCLNPERLAEHLTEWGLAAWPAGAGTQGRWIRWHPARGSDAASRRAATVSLEGGAETGGKGQRGERRSVRARAAVSLCDHET